MPKLLTYKLLTVGFFVLSCPFLLCAQNCHLEGTVFINEIGNFGGDGEYVELVVVGISSNPTAPVNLEGYIIDDNNYPDVDKGNEPGHLRLGSCFRAVPPGTIILIYGGSTTPPGINPNSNGTSGAVWQTSDGSCIIGMENVPNHSSGDYAGGTPSPVTNTKDFIPMRNWGDVIQVRTPDGELVHAISWIGNFEGNGESKTIQIASSDLGDQAVKMVAAGDWFNAANYQVSVQGSPGAANSVENEGLIDKIKKGEFSQTIFATFTIVQQPTGRIGGKIDVTVKNGTPPFLVALTSSAFSTERWYNTNGTFLIENLPSSQYKLVVEDAKKCAYLFEVELIRPMVLCAGECKQIGVSPGEYCFTEWLHNGSYEPMLIVCPTETTIYKMKVVNSEGIFEIKSFTVEVSEAEIVPNPTLICLNQTKNLTVKGPNQSYIWSTGQTTPSIQVSTPGKYTVTVLGDDGCLKKGIANVLNAVDPNAIKTYFLEMGFSANYGVRIESYPNRPPTGEMIQSRVMNCFHDESNDLLFLEGEKIDLEETLKNMCASTAGEYTNVWLTDNESFCRDGLIESIESNFWSSEKNAWFHLFKFGEESILFFKNNKRFNGNQPDTPDPERLFKPYLTFYVDLNCPQPTPLRDDGSNHYGRIFEDTWHSFANVNFNQINYNWNYHKNDVIYETCDLLPQVGPPPFGTLPIRPNARPRRSTEPDGTSTKVCRSNASNGLFFAGIIQCLTGAFYDGIIFYEAKATAEDVVFYKSYNDYQIFNHISNLRCNFSDYIGLTELLAHVVVVSTAGGRLSTALIDHARGQVLPPSGLGPTPQMSEWIGLHHFKAYFSFDQNGTMLVEFRAQIITLDRIAWGEMQIGNKLGVPVPLKCN